MAKKTMFDLPSLVEAFVQKVNNDLIGIYPVETRMNGDGSRLADAK